jgi:hypothetical protein
MPEKTHFSASSPRKWLKINQNIPSCLAPSPQIYGVFVQIDHLPKQIS